MIFLLPLLSLARAADLSPQLTMLDTPVMLPLNAGLPLAAIMRTFSDNLILKMKANKVHVEVSKSLHPSQFGQLLPSETLHQMMGVDAEVDSVLAKHANYLLSLGRPSSHPLAQYLDRLDLAWRLSFNFMSIYMVGFEKDGLLVALKDAGADDHCIASVVYVMLKGGGARLIAPTVALHVRKALTGIVWAESFLNDHLVPMFNDDNLSLAKINSQTPLIRQLEMETRVKIESRGDESLKKYTRKYESGMFVEALLYLLRRQHE